MYTFIRSNYNTSAYGRTSIYTRSTINNCQRMKVYYIMDYLPKRYDGTREQILNRQAIFDFKDGCCGNRILTGLTDGVRRLADSNTVVCFVPASTSFKTERRYEDIAEYIFGKTGICCSYTAISKPNDGESGHIGGKSADPAAEFSFNSSFFSGKKVILIDDVITRGTTLESTARRLKSQGALEVIGLVVGKTVNPDWNGGDRRNLEQL